MKNPIPVRQIFYTIDHTTLLPISRKERVDVHKDGDWHLAVTAFIFRKNLDGNLEVLVQERSEYVDIAQKHFDQSLATQLLVEDENDAEKALYRGLKEELGLHKDDIEKLMLWNEPGHLYISKQYKNNPELWNREVVSTYLIYVKYNTGMTKNFKVLDLEWLPWEELCNLVRIRPNKFTKSVRMYCVPSDISNDIYTKIKAIADEAGKVDPFEGQMFYDSLSDMDIIATKMGKSTDWMVEVYLTEYSMSKQKRVVRKDVSAIKERMFADENGLSIEQVLNTMNLKD